MNLAPRYEGCKVNACGVAGELDLHSRRLNYCLLIAVAALLLAFGMKGALIAPPSPPAKVAAGAFDTQRASGRLARILGDERPHPVDSPANDAVRERLMAELRGIGLDPQVRAAMDCNITPESRGMGCAMTRNVVASISSTPFRVNVQNALAVQLAANNLMVTGGVAGKFTGTIKRTSGFTGAVNVQILNLPAGSTVPTVTITPDKETFELPVMTAAVTAALDVPNVAFRVTAAETGKLLQADTPLATKITAPAQ